VTTSTRSISACGKVLMSTTPVRLDATERWPSSSTRVRDAPRLRRLSALRPARPLEIAELELAGVALPASCGSSLTKSATLLEAEFAICSDPTTVSGVGAL
jgi:hypothetical protein